MEQWSQPNLANSRGEMLPEWLKFANTCVAARCVADAAADDDTRPTRPVWRSMSNSQVQSLDVMNLVGLLTSACAALRGACLAADTG